MADPAVGWVPLAGLLEAASNELEVGQMLHTSVFSLFEAMSAVEIGNPKMDAGARPKGDQTPLADRPLPIELSPPQLLRLMDHLMCLEATWHNGGALARTLYSSLYMMQPDRTAGQPTLSAFCRALEATCAEVNHLVMTGGVCEEEDFNVHIAGLPLEQIATAAGAPATGASPPAAHSSSKKGKAAAAAAAAAASAHVDKVFAALSQAIDSQDVAMKQWQQQQGGGNGSNEAAVAAAIVCRLQFRKQLLQGLIKLKRKQKQDLDQASKLFVKAQAELEAIKDSLDLSGLSNSTTAAAAAAAAAAEPAAGAAAAAAAKPAHGAAAAAAAAGEGGPVSPDVLRELCWDENMNNHLIPAVPPRNIKVFSPSQAVGYLERMVAQLIRVCSITSVTTYPGLKDFLTGFMYNGIQPGFSVCPIARSALHSQVSYTAWVPVEASPQQQQQQQQQQPVADSCSCCDHSASAAAVGGPAALDQIHHSHIQQPHTAAPAHTPAAAAADGHADGAAATPPPSPAAAAPAAAAAADVQLPAWVLSPRMLRSALLLSPDEPLGDDAELFVDQAVIAAGNLVQALLMNPSRCRRRLRRGLEDWANLYQHALNADTSAVFQAYMTVHGWKWTPPHPEEIAGPLATWVESETAWVMVRHLLMGFELQLYEPADYTMIYWYVDALTTVHQQGTRMAKEQRPSVIATAPPPAAAAAAAAAAATSPKLPSRAGSKAAKSPSSRSSGTGGSNAATAAATAAALQAYTAQATLTQLFCDVHKMLAMGTVRVLLSLPMLGMWSPPKLLFNSQAQRYDQRFASFHTLQRPDPLAYEQYVASTDVTGAEAEVLLKLAQDNFAKAHQACVFIKAQGAAMGLSKQQQEELPQLDRVASTNIVAVVLLMRAAAAASKQAGNRGGADAANGTAAAAAPALPFKPFWEFGHHKWFPTLVLKSSAAAAAGVKQ